MGMTTLLSLTAMFGATGRSTPKVSYISYLDIWMMVCIIFVFLSMVEFTVVQILYRRNRKLKAESFEQTMRCMIPTMFIGFNLVYWNVLLEFLP